MSYLLFLDESGHDHRNAPYEVRGGIALHDERLWPFVQEMKQQEMACFGGLLQEFKSEIKGHRLLDKDRFSWAARSYPLDDNTRQRLCLSFLRKGTVKFQQVDPTKEEFTAYGQACLRMTDGIFDLLSQHEAKLFAAAIPRGATKPTTFEADEFFRKDMVFLLERFFYFLEMNQETGLLVMDQTECNEDRRFVRRLERYFSMTEPGRKRASRIVPSPFFVSSEMTYPVQAADVCIYCINHGFRLPKRGMNEPVRQEIASRYGERINGLQFNCTVSRGWDSFESYGVVYVSDPYQSRLW